ncbi:MAG: hypothetical protein ABJL72_16815 [Roseobacter sp.]
MRDPRPDHSETPVQQWQDVRVTAGSLSNERLPKPLEPYRFKIRPQNLAEAFCAAGERLGAADVGLARETRDARPWARLFQGEPAYLFAQILNFRADDAGFVFAEALEQDPAQAQVLVLELAKQLRGWITRIRLDVPGPFAKQLNQLDKEIKLTALLDAISDGGSRKLLRTAQTHHSVLSAEKNGVLAKARATRDRVRSLHALLRNAVSSLQPSAQAAFDARITSGEIDPGLGLLLAELRTAAHVDAAINALPERHTTLYYQDIIGQEPALASPERVLLSLGSVPKVGFLPAGATLDARLADGTVQRFETETSIPISPSRVSAVSLVSYETNENISYNRALGGITGMKVATKDPNLSLSSEKALFQSGSAQTVDVGLDIASPMLSLAEGTRRIEVSLHMNRTSNLPAMSRALSTAEMGQRMEKHSEQSARRISSGRRRNIDMLPMNADPDVRLALAADPALVGAFYSEKLDVVIESLTQEITEFATLQHKTTSLGLIYEYLMDQVTGTKQLRLLLGRIVTLSLIEQHPFPADEYWDKIFALVQRFREDLIGKTPTEPDASDHAQSSMIFAAFSQRPDGSIDYPPEDVFQSLLGDAFDITVTTEDGPRRPDIMQVLPVRHKRSDGGITLSLRYDNSAPALTGIQNAPRLALRYALDARLCPVSFFEAYDIETITIKTQVSGLRRLAAFSDDAPVITDQTFQPFGPRPGEGATFQVGCAEMARKPVTDVSIQLEWAAMPNPIGGFESHYQHYGKNLEIPTPQIAIDYLSGDGWKPVSEGAHPLFQTEGVTGALLSNWHFSGTVSGHSVPATGAVTATEFQSRQTVRAGLVRMRLSGTAGGFLAERYPMALMDAMRPRIIPVGTRAVPPAPFVPEISHFSLSYTAQSTIELNAPDTAKSGEEIHQVGPFGKVSLFPTRQAKQARLFPKRLGYGQISFQLTGPNTTGPVALTLAMASSGHLRRVPAPNPIKWYYLAPNGWQLMPETSMSSDSTAGLMRSGVVVIDLPEDATDHSSQMPPGGVWIAAVATRPNLDVFPALAQATVNGVWVRRSDDTWKETGATRKWSFNPVQPALSNLTEVGSATQTRPPEPKDMFVARVGERLRHRQRAVTPWDMERMVLEAFPEIWMAKCLPHLSQQTPTPSPGHVTLVVTRKPAIEDMTRRPQPALFDVTTLEQIRSWLQRYCNETIRLDVVNPTFERLQVRAKIALSTDREDGAMAQVLRHELTRSLSVWTAPPTLQRFGWSLNMHMLRAQIAGMQYVEKVSDFSVLHLAGDDSRTFQLLDTAQEHRDPRGIYGPGLRPRFPWSLPLSAANHTLTILPELSEETASAAGIGSLALGDMLIVSQRTQP